ncbi:MAG: type VI secretion protein, partial [Bradyrhizobium sp. PARBB1]
MVARALLDELTYGAVSRRERPVASHVPYTRHVDDHIIRTRDGLVLTIFKLDGYSFETSDISEVNARLLGRNDIVRTLANSRFALVSHIVRREVQPRIDSTFDNAFCAELDERYNAALSKRRMFVNDLYLTIVRRPLQGQAGTFDMMLTKLLGRKDEAGESVARQTALNELRDVATAVRESLAAYGVRQLGVVNRDGVWFSEPLEFLVQLLNGGLSRPMHLPRMDLADALAMKRVFFGRNAIEIKGAGPADTRFGAMVSIREYPAQTGPGSFDNLLRVPHEFIATQSFAIVDRPEAAKQIARVSRQV